MKDEQQPYPKPPQPPEIERKVQLHRFQIGLAFIFLLPVLALIGVFGESSNSVNGSNAQLLIEVEYPTRFRYKIINPIQVSVQNLSEQPIPIVEVNFDRDYMDGFSNVTFTPSVKQVTGEDYVVEITDLQPQETRVVSVEIQAEKYWRHQGTITADPDNGESVTVSLDSFVFP